MEIEHQPDTITYLVPIMIAAPRPCAARRAKIGAVGLDAESGLARVPEYWLLEA
jgi:hypothetical protein